MIALRHAPEARRNERGAAEAWFAQVATTDDEGYLARHSHPRTDGSRVCITAFCGRGHGMELSPLVHRVAADGAVSPSLVCPRCDWHVFVRLDGWTP